MSWEWKLKHVGVNCDLTTAVPRLPTDPLHRTISSDTLNQSFIILSPSFYAVLIRNSMTLLSGWLSVTVFAEGQIRNYVSSVTGHNVNFSVISKWSRSICSNIGTDFLHSRTETQGHTVCCFVNRNEARRQLFFLVAMLLKDGHDSRIRVSSETSCKFFGKKLCLSAFEINCWSPEFVVGNRS